MTTTITKTVALSGQQFTTLDAALTSLKAGTVDLVASDQAWEIVVYGGGEIVGSVFTIAGITTDATRRLVVRAATGQSFNDNATKATNALRYNSANGAAFASTGSAIDIQVDHVTIDGLQVSGSGGGWGIKQSVGGTDVVVKNCIVRSDTAATGTGAIMLTTGGVAINCTAVTTGGGGGCLSMGGGPTWHNVTTIQLGTATAYGFSTNYDAPTCTNCLAFGFGTNYRPAVTGNYNGSSQASPPGANSLGNLTASSVFTNVASLATLDMRPLSTSTIVSAGTRDQSFTADLDILKRARSITAPTLGAMEYIAPPAADTVPPTMTGTVTSSGVTSTGFTIDWSGTTRSDNVAITGYETSPDGGTTWVDRGNVTSYAYTGLAASTSYTRLVRAYDAAGNKSTPALSITVVTSAPSGDTTLPVLAGSITQGAITSTASTISWPAGTDNVAVTSYEVSKDAGTTYTDVGNVLTYTFTGLTASTAYTQKVRAKDAAGNVSTPALSLAVTTTATTVGSFTSRPLVNDTGTVLASLANWTVLIYSLTSNALLATKTGLTTSTSGVLTYSDAACTAGTTYRVVYISPTGDEGMNKLAAT